MNQTLQNIIISRTDSIGDVILTLPLAKILKSNFPDLKIAFLGKNYTRPVIECCEYVDEFIELNDFFKNDVTIADKAPQAIIHVFPVNEIAHRAKALGIPLRIGTTNRLFHWTTCNKLVKLSRKKSNLHEAQLNIKLLSPFNIRTDYNVDELGNAFGFTHLQALDTSFRSFIHPAKKNIILHPKSQGSAREWGLDNFISLIKLLDKNHFNILISGTEKERSLLMPLFEAVGNAVVDITGRMNLSQFISFINHCDALVANSTGPLHIAAALGKHAFGIYPPIRPMHPGRWAPLGKNAHVFVMQKECIACKNDSTSCSCIKEITPQEITAAISLYL